jgi:two-component sensor histidine kinase
LELSWTERGGPRVVEAGKAAPAGSGFGVQMTTMAAAQLGGAIVREWPPEGAIVRLTFPLPQREPGEG